MIKIHRYAEKIEIESNDKPAQVLSLPYDVRKKSRFIAVSDSGEKLGLILPRGRVLRNGVLLKDETGRLILVVASPECLSLASSSDAYKLTLAAYHLGNRHVPVQVKKDSLSYQHDDVLDAMVQGLGLSVSVEQLPFEPEEGAYASTSTSGHHGRHHEEKHGHSH